jgi:hypothetical protein
VWGGLAAATAAGAAAAALLAGGGDPGTTTAGRSPAGVVKADVTALVARYAAAYSAEALPALRSLMAPGFERRSGSGPVEGRRRALAAYARQFRDLDDPSYRVSGLQITTAGDAASARGRYRITSPTGTFTGRVRFEMARVSGRLLLTRVTATPTVATVGRADVAALVDRYAAAYSAESVARLSALFAPGFQRLNVGDPTQSRAEALGAYADQFASLTGPRYRTTALTIATGRGIALARARYSITSAAGTVSGRIYFQVAATGDGLLFTRIITAPDDTTPAPSEPATPSDEGTGDAPAPSRPAPAEPATPSDEGDADGGYLTPIYPTTTPDLY